MIGRTLGGYRIIEQIGSGGMATIYKAYDPNTDRNVAIKTLPQQYHANPEFRTRFEQEAHAIARLEHLHILPVFTYGEQEGITFMVMRYMDAGTLAEAMKDKQLPFMLAAKWIKQLASALDYAHSFDILHRDIKPTNALVDKQENVFLTDFGIAKIIGTDSKLTGPDSIIGTPQYMSPEQFVPNNALTPASDQYSLGVVLYEMVTGRTPYQAATPWAIVAMRQRREQIPLPRSLRPDLPEAAEKVILKALSDIPSSRFQSCATMAEAFTKAVSAHPGIQQPVAPPSVQVKSDILSAETVRPGFTQPTPVIGRWLLPLLLLAGIVVLGLALITTPQNMPPLTQSIVPSPDTLSLNAAIVGDGLTPPRSGLRLRLCPPLCIRILTDDVEQQEIPVPEVDTSNIYSSAWSPDGQRIAFSQKIEGANNAFFIMNRGGDNLTRIPFISGNIAYLAWSPDDQWIAMHNNCRLAIIHPNRSGLKYFEREGQYCYLAPQWSPDSQQIVVIREASGLPGNFPTDFEVRLVSVTSNTLEILKTVHHEDARCADWSVAFSPDGQKIAYIDETCQTNLINKDGSGQPTVLQSFPYWWQSDFYPQWGVASQG